MSDAGKMLEIKVNAHHPFQSIDGFGVNINARYFVGDKLLPAMRLLGEDLGATLYRVDIWGKSDWIDPTGELGMAALDPVHLAQVYQGEIFQRGWALMHYLNSQGIKPYLTASGNVPAWMLGADKRTLVDYEACCEMLVSMVDWARNHEHLDFKLFGPFNETDIGQPEGPGINPVEFARVCEILDAKLTQRGLDDIRLVVAEQAMFNKDYFRELTHNANLVRRIGVFTLHDYSNYPLTVYHDVTSEVKNSLYAGSRLWMTEFGDLEQSGEREWYVAWTMASRLFDQLESGFNAALVWDAFDNYHDHDEAWTIYGLLRSGLRVFTPKKRFYSMKQVFRYVPPGFDRIEVEAHSEDVRLLAFADPERTQFTLVGMNLTGRNFYLNVKLEGFSRQVMEGKAAYYRTTETENCICTGEIPVRGPNYPFSGINALIPGDSIFTLTTVK